MSFDVTQFRHWHSCRLPSQAVCCVIIAAVVTVSCCNRTGDGVVLHVLRLVVSCEISFDVTQFRHYHSCRLRYKRSVVVAAFSTATVGEALRQVVSCEMRCLTSLSSDTDIAADSVTSGLLLVLCAYVSADPSLFFQIALSSAGFDLALAC